MRVWTCTSSGRRGTRRGSSSARAAAGAAWRNAADVLVCPFFLSSLPARRQPGESAGGRPEEGGRGQIVTVLFCSSGDERCLFSVGARGVKKKNFVVDETVRDAAHNKDGGRWMVLAVEMAVVGWRLILEAAASERADVAAHRPITKATAGGIEGDALLFSRGAAAALARGCLRRSPAAILSQGRGPTPQHTEGVSGGDRIGRRGGPGERGGKEGGCAARSGGRSGGQGRPAAIAT